MTLFLIGLFFGAALGFVFGAEEVASAPRSEQDGGGEEVRCVRCARALESGMSRKRPSRPIFSASHGAS